MLPLPDNFEIAKARISRVNLTLPVAFHNTGIVFEVEGIEIQARLSQKDNNQGKEGTNTPSRSNKKGKSRAKKATFEDDPEDKPHLPTVEELAQSFLAEEPAEEREELEAAIYSHLEDYESEEEDVGTGTGVSLPFVANMIKGIADRLKGSIRDVKLALDIELPDESVVSHWCHVESVEIEGLTMGGQAADETNANASEESGSAQRKRRIRLLGLSSDIITDPDTFANMDRVSSTHTPSTTHSPVVPSSTNSLHQSHASVSSRSRGSPKATWEPQREQDLWSDSGRSSIQYEQQVYAGRQNDSRSIRLYTETPNSLYSPPMGVEGDRFADANEDDDEYGPSRSQLSFLTPSRAFHDTSESELLDNDFPFAMEDNETSVQEPMDEHQLYASPSASLILNYSPPEEPRRSRTDESRGRRTFDARRGLAATTTLTSLPQYEQPFAAHNLPIFSSQPTPSSEPFPHIDNAPLYSHSQRTSSPSPARSSGSENSSDGQSHSGDEDLSASRIFSHEEAESMYMSAMSEASPKASSHINMPGGWDRSMSSIGESQTSSSSRNHNRQVERPPAEDSGMETPRPGSPVDGGSFVETETCIPLSSPAASTSPPLRTYPDSEKVAKRVFTLDEVCILLPWQTEQDEDESGTDLPPEDPAMSTFEDYSTYEDMPGAFSQHGPRRGKDRWPPATNAVKRQTPTVNSETSSRHESSHVEVEIGSLTSQIDISSGRLLFATIEQLIAAWSDRLPVSRRSVADQTATAEATQVLKLTAKNLTLSFVEQMSFVPINMDETGVRAPPTTSEPLFAISFVGIGLSSKSNNSNVKATVNINTVKFGSPDAQIICFDKGSLKTTNTDQQRRDDISISFSNEAPRGPEITIKMLRLLVNLDMHKLDDQLSCFGGLSGILDLSSSMTSNSTVHAASPVPQPKGVRFDAPGSAATPSLSPIKINSKIDGMIFNLHGKACGVSLENSAMRLVARETYASLQIDQIRFTGPFENNERTEPPLVVNVTSTKFIFLVTPAEEDLTQLVDLITPSRDKYEDEDDILLDTLLRQRKKGSLLRVLISDVHASIDAIEKIQGFRLLSDEISKLSSVAKYLPEDDRPGLLTIAKVESVTVEAWINQSIGSITADCTQFRIAHVGLPALLALEVGTIGLIRGEEEELVGSLLQLQPVDRLPMVMARIIGDELKPTIKVKLFNVVAEYHIPTIMAVMGLDLASSTTAPLVGSVATVRGGSAHGGFERQDSANTMASNSAIQPFHVDLLLRDCALGLNPGNSPSKALFLLKNARATASTSAKEDFNTKIELRKAAVLLVDDTHNLDLTAQPALRPKSSHLTSPTETDLGRQGFQSVASVSNAEVIVQTKQSDQASAVIDVVLAVEIFILESCADSTQTLVTVLSGLAPPIPTNDTTDQYRTNVVPFRDMMASITGEAFAQPESEEDEDELDMVDADQLIEDLPANYEFVGSFFEPEAKLKGEDEQAGSSFGSESRRSARSSYYRPKGNFQFEREIEDDFEHDTPNVRLDVSDNYLGRMRAKAPVRRWNPNNNKFLSIHQFEVKNCPIRVKLNVKSLIWNLHDGYDWSKTRETIARAVDEIEARAEKRRREREGASLDDDEQESEIGDFLFQSIWIAVPPNRDEHDLRRQINRDMDDLTSETGTVTTATDTHLSGRPSRTHKRRKLRLGRSPSPKICFDLSGVAVDMLALPPGSETTQNSIMVKIQDMSILDALPTSTWNKFMGYMHDAGEPPREKPMIRLELVTVRPVLELAATELVIKVRPL
jgi:autophagy-related protein 2